MISKVPDILSSISSEVITFFTLGVLYGLKRLWSFFYNLFKKDRDLRDEARIEKHTTPIKEEVAKHSVDLLELKDSQNKVYEKLREVNHGIKNKNAAEEGTMSAVLDLVSRLDEKMDNNNKNK